MSRREIKFGIQSDFVSLFLIVFLIVISAVISDGRRTVSCIIWYNGQLSSFDTTTATQDKSSISTLENMMEFTLLIVFRRTCEFKWLLFTCLKCPWQLLFFHHWKMHFSSISVCFSRSFSHSAIKYWSKIVSMQIKAQWNCFLFRFIHFHLENVFFSPSSLFFKYLF